MTTNKTNIPTVLNNIEWQVLRAALIEWRTLHLTDPEFKKTASYSLEDKIDLMFTEKIKEHKL